MNAAQLAAIYDEHLTQIWRNGSGHPALDRGWLEQWWTADCPKEPNSPPDATSILAAGGAGIRWRETDTELLGYVPSRIGGCYRVPKTAANSLRNQARAAA
jgi:hypothetical protein